MKIYCIAGELSGDKHGASLIESLSKIDPDLEVRGWGGDHMEAAGATVVKHIRDLAFMGFYEVVKKANQIRKNFAFCKKDILEFGPTRLLLIDYPGFNLRIAKWAHENGIPVDYYIAPQTWAWKEYRNKDLMRYVDNLLCIIPFEESYFLSKKVPAKYIGNPLIQDIEKYQAQHPSKKDSTKKVLALLPGSRKQEVERHLPIMLSTARQIEDVDIVVAGVSHIDSKIYFRLMDEYAQTKVHLKMDDPYAVLSEADRAIVASGTASLEAALFGVPQIVIYKVNPIGYTIARRAVKVPFISMVNLIADQQVVPELIQNQLTTDNLLSELKDLQIQKTRDTMINGYALVKNKIGTQNASEQAAQIIMNSAQL